MFASLPAILGVLVASMIFWLVFAIMGVQMFAGKFYKVKTKFYLLKIKWFNLFYFQCLDRTNSTFNAEIVNNRSVCEAKNYKWENSFMNFDHVGHAYMSLLQVATFKGWILIMSDATDSREVSFGKFKFYG